MTLAALIAASEQEREDWHYTSLRALRDTVFVPAAAATVTAAQLPPRLSAEGQRLVFVNGIHQQKLSDAVAGFTSAGDGYRLTVPEATCLATAPVEVLFMSVKTAQAQQSTCTFTVTLGANARLTLLERHISLGEGAAQAALVTLRAQLAAQAKLVQLKLQEMDMGDYHLAQSEAALDKGAYYDQFCLTTGAALSRHTITVALNAPEAQTRLLGAYLLRGAQHGDTTSTVRHNAPQTTSQEHYRGVLDGKARGVFQGKIIVAPQAQKSDGQQMSRALLLSDTAEANSKPELEIYADDVKCSHGATVGQIDAQALFYLQSRGIPAAQARALLTQAFIAEVIEGIGTEIGRDAATRRAEAWMAA